LDDLGSKKGNIFSQRCYYINGRILWV